VTDEEWDLVPLETIGDVLARRFDSVVIVGCRPKGKGTDCSIYMDGPKLECIGLLHYAAFRVSQGLRRSEQAS